MGTVGIRASGQSSTEHSSLSAEAKHKFPTALLLISSQVIAWAIPCMRSSTAAPQQGAGFELPRLHVWPILLAVLILQYVCLFVMQITVRGISKQAFAPVWDWACALTILLIFNKRATTACLH